MPVCGSLTFSLKRHTLWIKLQYFCHTRAVQVMAALIVKEFLSGLICPPNVYLPFQSPEAFIRTTAFNIKGLNFAHITVAGMIILK